ncbi:MAG: hypothetical protein HRU34_19165 [Richelia sp.]|nr:hypothetical protein [Richelia sp.]
MLELCNLEIPGIQVVDIPVSDRWQIYYRLQQLQIKCWCPLDGCLKVEIRSDLDAILVSSTIMQTTGTRQELVTWLCQCWQL